MTTNRVKHSGFTYQATGELTGDGTHTYQWDAEARLQSVDNGSTASYTYNALGQRVEKKVGAAYTEVLYDASGESLGENNRTTWTQSYVNFMGRHVVIYANNKTYFTHVNTLGSTTAVTDYGALVEDPPRRVLPLGSGLVGGGHLAGEALCQTPTSRFRNQPGPDPLPHVLIN